jgi:hypothetical protein
MSERGTQLFDTAERQISELIGLLSARGQASLSLSCPGREKLGDGTVAALALHTADNYLRIAGFLQAMGRMPAARPGAEGGHNAGTHDGDYTAGEVDVRGVLERLSAGRNALSLLTADARRHAVQAGAADRPTS